MTAAHDHTRKADQNKDRLKRLAAFAPIFRDPKTVFGEMIAGTGSGTMQDPLTFPWPFLNVRRGKARFPSGRQTHPATFAPAGSNRSSRGGDEAAEAFGAEGHFGDSASMRVATCSER